MPPERPVPSPDRPLRIALDARAIAWREGTGVARYRATLAAAARRIGTVEAIGDGAPRPAWRDWPRALGGRLTARRDGDGWRIDDVYRLAQRRFTATGRLLAVALPDPPGIVHWSHPMPLVMAGATNVCTVHDLIPLEQPTLTGMSGPRQDRLLRRLIEAEVHLATVSETVRHGLIDRYRLSEAQVTCCYQAVEPGGPGTLPPGLVPGGYLLALGRVETRKNIDRLIAAYARSGVTLPLVIAGPDGHWADPAERDRVAHACRQRGVIRLGWQSDAVAAGLLANARALLMPSLAEGFGLPAIEAMAHGVPALVGDRGAQAEIAGEAALPVDPRDIAAIAAGIARLVHDAPVRADVIARGRARARDFGMETFAARLAALYDCLK